MLRTIAYSFAIVLAFHLAWPPFYRYPAARPFAGERWYDPYVGVGDADWLRMNTHAHSKAWWSLTNGRRTADEVRAFYEDQGYDLGIVTNYQSIYDPPDDGTIGLGGYEQGYNLAQVHHTVLGADRVSWREFPLFQLRRHKQYVLDGLREAPFVVLNHPNRCDACGERDAATLTGFHGIEIKSKYAQALPVWDAALSAGRPVWGLCSDDGHDLSRASHQGIGWLRVASEPDEESVLAALRAGRFYGVWTRQKDRPNELSSCSFAGGALEVSVARPADAIRFVGQGGTVLSAALDTDHATYRPAPGDAYVRVEVETGRTTLYLNPIFRYDRDPLEIASAQVLVLPTWGTRLLALALLLLLGYALFGARPVTTRAGRIGRGRIHRAA